jgi:hypothetical protein
MGETQSKTQLPMQEIVGPGRPAQDPFRQGLESGRQVAELAARRIAAWAEENPGQLLLAGLAAGFVLGKVLFRGRRTASEIVEE